MTFAWPVQRRTPRRMRPISRRTESPWSSSSVTSLKEQSMPVVPRVLLSVALITALSAETFAQDQGRAGRAGRGATADAGRGRGRGGRGGDAQGPWFGVMLPPPLGKDPAVIVGERQPRPFSMPQGEVSAPEFTGSTIRADMETIVG